MSFNPYQSPGMAGHPPGMPGGSPAADRLKAPAIGLLVVTGISIVLLALSIAFDVFLVATGLIDRWDDDPNESLKRVQVTVRIVWGLLILLSNLGSLYGALQMLWLENRTFAQAGCILACIPCFSPCLILGIPFGIWGLIVLNDGQVQREFKS